MVHAHGTAVSQLVAAWGLSVAVQLVVAMPVCCSVHARSPMHGGGMYSLCERPTASYGVRIYVI